MDLKPSWEKDGWCSPEAVLLKDLTRRFSGAPPQLSLRPPQMQEIRRSPMYLAPRGQFKRERAFLPELNCPLNHVKYCTDGCLEFNKEVTQLYQARVILEALPPGESKKESSVRLLHTSNRSMGKNGMKREQDILSLHKLMQESWVFAGSASPAPTLDPIFVKRGSGFTPHTLVRIQFSESIMSTEDLIWDNCEKLVCRPYVAGRMISGASLWIDDDHPVLSNFGRLSEQPTLYATSNNDIMRNHLLKRRWVWITRLHHGKTVIDIPRTEEFYDARLAFFEHGIDCLLRKFCQRRQWTQKQTEKLATTRSIRGKLEQLMMMSQLAGMKIKADSAAAATYGPWLDFMVSSTSNENDQIFRAVRELEVARYFILGLIFMAENNMKGKDNPVEVGDGTKLLGVPEFSDLNDTNDLRSAAEILSAESLKQNGSADRCTRRKGKPCALLALVGGPRQSLTEWQQMRIMLQNVKGFCPQNEAECALILVTRRQERRVLEEKVKQERKILSGVGERIFQVYTNTNRVEYPPRCQCSSDSCEYRKGFLEREISRRQEDKGLYFSKVNDTGDLQHSESLSSKEGISQGLEENEEPAKSQEPGQHQEPKQNLDSERIPEPEKSLGSERSHGSKTSNTEPKSGFRCKLTRLLSYFQPSTKFGSPSQLDVPATHEIRAAMETGMPQVVSKVLPTTPSSTPVEEETAGVTSASVEEDCRPTTMRLVQDTSDSVLSSSVKSQQTTSPVDSLPLKDTPPSCSDTNFVARDPSRTKEVTSTPIIAPAVPRQIPSRQSGIAPKVLTAIIDVGEAEQRHRESYASVLTHDSGYKSKDSTESARSEQPLKTEIPIAAGDLESLKIAPENIPLPVDAEDEIQFVLA